MKISTLLAGTTAASMLATTMQHDILNQKELSTTDNGRTKLRALVDGYASQIDTFCATQKGNPNIPVISIDERKALRDQFGLVIGKVFFSSQPNIDEAGLKKNALYARISALLVPMNGHAPDGMSTGAGHKGARVPGQHVSG